MKNKIISSSSLFFLIHRYRHQQCYCYRFYCYSGGGGDGGGGGGGIIIIHTVDCCLLFIIIIISLVCCYRHRYALFSFLQRFDIKKFLPVIILNTVRNNGCKAIAKRLVKFNFQADISNFTAERRFMKSLSAVKLTTQF